MKFVNNDLIWPIDLKGHSYELLLKKEIDENVYYELSSPKAEDEDTTIDSSQMLQLTRIHLDKNKSYCLAYIWYIERFNKIKVKINYSDEEDFEDEELEIILNLVDIASKELLKRYVKTETD